MRFEQIEERRAEMRTPRKTWSEIRAERALQPNIGPIYPNAQLLVRAAKAAEELHKIPTTMSVGLFGSTSRGEAGHDIDLFVLETSGLSQEAIEKCINRGTALSYARFSDICLAEFVARERIGLDSNLGQFIAKTPRCQLVFADPLILGNQMYLDLLIACGNCTDFYHEVWKDILFYDTTEKRFRKSGAFRFVNQGLPSDKLLQMMFGPQSEGGENEPTAPLKLKKATPEVPPPAEATFEQVGGQSAAKEEVMGLAAALRNPERYKRWGTKPPRGICLFGPPGTGKTLLAKALSKAVQVPFYNVDSSQLMSKWYGESEQNVDKAFEEARKTGGILFFDEADALAATRNDSHEVTKRVVAALCRNMDGFNASDKVVVFFATNRPEDMDPAVVRPGRVDKIINVPLPDRSGRNEIFAIHMKKARGLAERELFEEINVEELLERTDGYSGADIAEIVRRVLETKVRAEEHGEKTDLVTTDNFLAEISGYDHAKKSRNEIGFGKKHQA